MNSPIEEKTPLCVDLDETLVQSDLLVETILKFGKQNPLSILKLPFWIVKGKKYFKHKIQQYVHFSYADLPYRSEVIKLIRDKKKKGCPVYLVSANTEKHVKGVSDYLKIFDNYFCSNSDLNLKGVYKAQFLSQKFGTKGFDYVGDHICDYEVFQSSRDAYFVGHKSVEKKLKIKGIHFIQSCCSGRISMKEFFRTIRIHQWLKNTLIFLPLLLSHQFLEIQKFYQAFAAFFAMSLTASATYIINDLFDIEADRAHPTKKFRPLASGKVKIQTAMLWSVLLFILSVTIAYLQSTVLLKLLLIYAIITLAYSFILKSIAILDVIVLAFLYTHRIIIGSVVTSIQISEWLFSFSIFLFFSLGFLKRNNEILKKIQSKDFKSTLLKGRGYSTNDLQIIQLFGISAGVCSVLIFVLYINSKAMNELYQVKHWLWLIAPLLLRWIGRMWLKATRGIMNEDPIVFTIKDFKGYLIFFMITIFMILSKYGIRIL